MVFYSDGSKDIPRTPVAIDLKIFDESRQSMTTVVTGISDSEGFTVFDSLAPNNYYIYPQQESDVGFIWSDTTEISDINLHDTVFV